MKVYTRVHVEDNGVALEDITISKCHQYLTCPHCTGIKLKAQNATINKSNDPYVVSIDFYCEECKSYSKMIFNEYFFATRLGWEKSVHIDEEDDTKEDV